MSEAQAHSADVAAPTWFGQPRGLTIIFLTEMWEKFSYYGMRSMLVYYMTRQLMLPQHQASLVYGTYTAFVYFTPILGGTIADRWLGKRRAVIIGASLMALGHFLMTFDALLYFALGSIALGNGLFLPSLPSQISGLYAPEDARVKHAFNIYYVGINIGGFVAPLVCGTIGELYGWHYGFGLAGIGMLIGLAVYLGGARYLPENRMCVGASTLGGYQQSRHRLLLFAAILAVVVLFRGAYEQIGNTVALWAGNDIDRATGSGFVIPMTWFQSLNSLFVFLLTPFVVALWTWQAKTRGEPSSMTKMAIGALLVAASYVMLAAVSADADSAGTRAAWWWLVLFFALITTGELYVLPVGLGLFARMAPAGFGATAIAAWYFAAFGGNLLAGTIGARWKLIGHSGFFIAVAGLACVAAIALKALDRAVKRETQVAAP
jgi:POT family proton-dependent oligopeptide transporter